jgi:hypothetical protein
VIDALNKSKESLGRYVQERFSFLFYPPLRT